MEAFKKISTLFLGGDAYRVVKIIEEILNVLISLFFGGEK